MEDALIEESAQPELTPRQPWHKPILNRLVVSLDTQVGKPGSVADGDQPDRLVGPVID